MEAKLHSPYLRAGHSPKTALGSCRSEGKGNIVSDESRSDDRQDLVRKVRGLKMLVFWAFLFGAGIGFYAGFVVGVDTGRTAQEIGIQRR